MKKIESLNWLFRFEIIGLHHRVLSVKIISIKKEINSEKIKKIFEWFMEDLIYFIEQQGYQKRWDFSIIELADIKKLEFSEKRLEAFIKLFKLVTNWEIRLKNENN